MQFTHTSNSTNDTLKMAQSFASILQNGDVVLLYGDVGAGKTDFARKIIQTHMANHSLVEDVPSPTFTLVQTYEFDEIEFLHADLYRISDYDEVYELGLERGFQEAVCLIEWPERLGTNAPENALSIHISIQDETVRDFKFSWTKPLWSDRLTELKSLKLGKIN